MKVWRTTSPGGMKNHFTWRFDQPLHLKVWPTTSTEGVNNLSCISLQSRWTFRDPSSMSFCISSCPWLFPKVKEACSTAAHLRALRHWTPTSTVPMLRTRGNSRPFRVLYFWEFRDFSRMHRWILNKPKYPQSFAFTDYAGYLQNASGKQYTLLYTSEVFERFQKYFVPFFFL